MSDLMSKPQTDAARDSEKTSAVPALDAAPALAMLRAGSTARALRRRFSATRLQIEDNSFRPFRVY
ncbi:MAG: hypothetical protein QM718_13140 [Steroidobacteraceae bacterium]